MLIQDGDHVNEDSSAGKDLGVLADSILYMSQQCTVVIMKANDTGLYQENHTQSRK